MKKNITAIILICCSAMALAQRNVVPTEKFRVFGKVKSEYTFTVADLEKYAAKPIPDRVIYNHKGEIKDTIKNLKGVLLTEVLAKVDFVYDKPKTLNEFYFVVSASDGYKVVFSWNEIYNTETGNNLYFITSMGGKKLSELPERIVLLAASDLKSGRRYIKSVEKIEVKQAD